MTTVWWLHSIASRSPTAYYNPCGWTISRLFDMAAMRRPSTSSTDYSSRHLEMDRLFKNPETRFFVKLLRVISTWYVWDICTGQALWFSIELFSLYLIPSEESLQAIEDNITVSNGMNVSKFPKPFKIIQLNGDFRTYFTILLTSDRIAICFRLSTRSKHGA